MSVADRSKWDERYRAGAYAEREHPSALLAEWEPRLPRGRALDVACGAGRNSLFLAATGRRVDAVDISAVALDRAREAANARRLQVRWIEADLDDDPDASLPRERYDLIVLIRYVNAKLLTVLLERLAPNGMLLCEQHVESSEDVVGPKTPAFRLRRNELLREVIAQRGSGDNVVYYSEGLVTDPDGRRAALAQLVLRREQA
ncbi:MAG TPA: methyltransferase domain-containing protein [Gammaproteobacteria bacterium]|jgi:SAM-dependent methyltransferase